MSNDMKKRAWKEGESQPAQKIATLKRTSQAAPAYSSAIFDTTIEKLSLSNQGSDESHLRTKSRRSVDLTLRNERKQKAKPRCFDNPQLPQLPRGFPLEPTSRAINLDDIKLDVLVKNITQCIKLLSLQAKYSNDQASVALLSEENVLMRLSIWKSQDHEATVEIQRCSGDHFAFRTYACQLLRAAGGELPKITHQDTDIRYLLKTEQLLRVEMARLGPLGMSLQMEPIVPLQIGHDLLMSNRPGARQSGLEMLGVLSNPRKTGIAVSVLVSRMMMMGAFEPGVKNEEAFEMQALLLDLITDKKKDISEPTETVDIDSDDEDDSGLHFPECARPKSIMTKLALKVLENCLEVTYAFEPYESDSFALSPETLVDNFMKDSKVSTKGSIIVMLLAQLGRADEHPHIARLAASCLRRLCKVSDEAFHETLKLGGKWTAEEAREVGRCCHSKLEWECSQLLCILNIRC